MTQPLTQVATIPARTVQGGRLKWVSATLVTMDPITTRDSTNTNNLVTSAVLTINTAISGFGGLDTGTMQNNKLYYTYVIGDSAQAHPTGVICALADNTIAPSAQAPLLPAGYDIYFRTGAFRTGALADALAFVQRGDPASPTMYYTAPIQIVTSGSATTTTAVSLLNIVPPLATQVDVRAEITPHSAGNSVSVGTPPLPVVSGPVAAVAQKNTAIVPTSEPYPVYVNYLVSNASDVANIYVRSYQDLLLA